MLELHSKRPRSHWWALHQENPPQIEASCGFLTHHFPLFSKQPNLEHSRIQLGRTDLRLFRECNWRRTCWHYTMCVHTWCCGTQCQCQCPLIFAPAWNHATPLHSFKLFVVQVCTSPISHGCPKPKHVNIQHINAMSLDFTPTWVQCPSIASHWGCLQMTLINHMALHCIAFYHIAR